jgi:hypothetical protein
MTAVFLFTACEYDAPLTRDHTIPIDQAVLGVWEATSEGTDSERALVLPFSETEYLVQYPMEKDSIFFRAYPISVGGVSCVQFEAIGSEEGAVEKDEKKRFHVVSYQLTGDALEIKLLNTERVDKGLADSEALLKAFIEHKDDADLFIDPVTFKKVAQ